MATTRRFSPTARREDRRGHKLAVFVVLVALVVSSTPVTAIDPEVPAAPAPPFEDFENGLSAFTVTGGDAAIDCSTGLPGCSLRLRPTAADRIVTARRAVGESVGAEGGFSFMVRHDRRSAEADNEVIVRYGDGKWIKLFTTESNGNNMFYMRFPNGGGGGFTTWSSPGSWYQFTVSIDYNSGRVRADAYTGYGHWLGGMESRQPYMFRSSLISSVEFRATLNTGMDEGPTYHFDSFSLVRQIDVAAKSVGPRLDGSHAGETCGAFTVSVQNLRASYTTGTVRLLVDENGNGREDAGEPELGRTSFAVRSRETRAFPISVTPPPDLMGTPMDLVAVVDAADDLDESNNAIASPDWTFVPCEILDWFRGDTHTHSSFPGEDLEYPFTDEVIEFHWGPGRYRPTLAENVQAAAEQLDFMVMTEHSPFAALWPGYFNLLSTIQPLSEQHRVTVVGGQEAGIRQHAGIAGLSLPVDLLPTPPHLAWRDCGTACLANTYGGVSWLNHPYGEKYTYLAPHAQTEHHGVEVLNGPFDQYESGVTEPAIDLLEDLNYNGLGSWVLWRGGNPRYAAIGGSDDHNANPNLAGPDPRRGDLGNPEGRGYAETWAHLGSVWSKLGYHQWGLADRQRAVVDAFRNGETVASRGGFMALYAEHDGEWFTSGETAPTKQPTKFKLVWKLEPGTTNVDVDVRYRPVFGDARSLAVPQAVQDAVNAARVGRVEWTPSGMTGDMGLVWLEAGFDLPTRSDQSLVTTPVWLDGGLGFFDAWGRQGERAAHKVVSVGEDAWDFVDATGIDDAVVNSVTWVGDQAAAAASGAADWLSDQCARLLCNSIMRPHPITLPDFSLPFLASGTAANGDAIASVTLTFALNEPVAFLVVLENGTVLRPDALPAWAAYREDTIGASEGGPATVARLTFTAAAQRAGVLAVGRGQPDATLQVGAFDGYTARVTGPAHAYPGTVHELELTYEEGGAPAAAALPVRIGERTVVATVGASGKTTVPLTVPADQPSGTMTVEVVGPFNETAARLDVEVIADFDLTITAPPRAYAHAWVPVEVAATKDGAPLSDVPIRVTLQPDGWYPVRVGDEVTPNGTWAKRVPLTDRAFTLTATVGSVAAATRVEPDFLANLTLAGPVAAVHGQTIDILIDATPADAPDGAEAWHVTCEGGALCGEAGAGSTTATTPAPVPVDRDIVAPQTSERGGTRPGVERPDRVEASAGDAGAVRVATFTRDVAGIAPFQVTGARIVGGAVDPGLVRLQDDRARVRVQVEPGVHEVAVRYAIGGAATNLTVPVYPSCDATAPNVLGCGSQASGLVTAGTRPSLQRATGVAAPQAPRCAPDDVDAAPCLDEPLHAPVPDCATLDVPGVCSEVPPPDVPPDTPPPETPEVPDLPGPPGLPSVPSPPPIQQCYRVPGFRNLLICPGIIILE